MKAKIKECFKEIEEIQILDDVLSSYSHTKFDRLFGYQSIKALFELFIAEEREEYLSNYKGVHRKRYQDVLKSIISRFRKQHDGPLNFSKMC